nr:retrovirus-related Pol polyprotein from transposon 17.6 [Tanacetum cinerariifolium]
MLFDVISYYPGKVNVVADALSRKERVKPKRRGLDEMIERRSDEALYYLDRIWVPFKGDVRTLIMDEAHKSKYSINPGANEMYYDLRDKYWWPRMKKDIVVYQPEIPEWKWEMIAMDFVTKLDVSTAYHPQINGQSECTIQTLEDMRRACVLDFEGSWDVHLPLVKLSYNNSYHSSIRCAPFKALYGDYVLLKVSLWKGVVRFGKKRKLAPRFVGPFEITERIGLIAYRLRLPEELNGVHDTFHMSIFKKCLADPTLQVPLDEIQVDAKLKIMKKSIEILERDSRSLTGVELPSSKFDGIRNVDLNLRRSVKII